MYKEKKVVYKSMGGRNINKKGTYVIQTPEGIILERFRGKATALNHLKNYKSSKPIIKKVK